MALRLSKHFRVALAALALGGMAMPATGQTRADHFVVKDMRGAEKSAVIFMAARGVEDLPVIVLFGANREVLAKVRAAALKSERAGYGVRAILVGPTTEAPSLGIYANTKGLGPSNSHLGVLEDAWKVTEPINPHSIRQDVLVRLIAEVHREYYAAQ